MDINIINKVENKLQNNRFKAELKYKSQLDELYSKYPLLFDLENKKRFIASDIKLSKNEKNLKLKEIENEINSFINDNHIVFPEKQYNCSKCSDTGYIENGNKKTRCNCFYKMIIDESTSEQSCHKILTLKCFDETLFSSDIKAQILQIRSFIEKYIEKFPDVKYPNLVLNGNTGTGKTFLLTCIYNELKQKGLGVIYITAGKLFDILRKYAFNEINDIDVLINCDMLIIDDLGTEPLFNNITVEYMFLLFNERKTNNKPICISTNLTPDEIKSRYTERIASRLFDKTSTSIIKIPGNDLRLR